MLRYLLMISISAFCFAPNGAFAEDVFDRLQNEPVSVLDFGIKRLRSSAIDATRRLAQPSDATPQTSVQFDAEKREFRILFNIRTRSDAVSMAACQERRIKAIKETFLVDATAYAVPVSNEQKVILRLGRIFTREPVAPSDSIQAMGERLAQSTVLRVTLASADTAATVTCEGRISELRIP